MRNRQKAKTKNQQPNGISSVKMRVLPRARRFDEYVRTPSNLGSIQKCCSTLKATTRTHAQADVFCLPFAFKLFSVVVVVAAADVWLNQLQNKNIFGDLNSILAITTVLIRKLRKKIITSNVH